MKNTSNSLHAVLKMAQVSAVIARRFDGHLGGHHGIGFNDFIILFHLASAPGERMRRIELAEKLGLTASGITRLLAPMEKIGLVKREVEKNDLRVSIVALAPGGKNLFHDAHLTAEETLQDFVVNQNEKKMKELYEILSLLPVTQIY